MNMKELLEDMRDNGLRFDLNPTYNLNEPHEFFHAYIKRMDESIRYRAAEALTAVPEAPNLAWVDNAAITDAASIVARYATELKQFPGLFVGLDYQLEEVWGNRCRRLMLTMRVDE